MNKIKNRVMIQTISFKIKDCRLINQRNQNTKITLRMIKQITIAWMTFMFKCQKITSQVIVQMTIEIQLSSQEQLWKSRQG